MVLEIKLVEHAGEPAVKPLGSRLVVGRIGQVNLPLAIDAHAVVGIGQVF